MRCAGALTGEYQVTRPYNLKGRVQPLHWGSLLERFIRLSLLATFALVGAATSAAAAQGATYVCAFAPADVWTVPEGGRGDFKPGNAGALNFEISGVTPGGASAMVDGSGPLRVVEALDARHFLEVNVAGYLNLTTIYEATTPDGAQLAVHSRHSGVAGRPVVAQYHGSCGVK